MITKYTEYIKENVEFNISVVNNTLRKITLELNSEINNSEERFSVRKATPTSHSVLYNFTIQSFLLEDFINIKVYEDSLYLYRNSNNYDDIYIKFTSHDDFYNKIKETILKAYIIEYIDYNSHDNNTQNFSIENDITLKNSIEELLNSYIKLNHISELMFMIKHNLLPKYFLTTL